MLPPLTKPIKIFVWLPCGLVIVWLCLLIWKWPFTRNAVVTGLEKDLGRTVQIGAFHSTFFPLGFVAEDISFVKTDPRSVASTITIRKAVVTANYLNVLFKRRRLDGISLTGLHVGIASHAQPRHSAKHRGQLKFTSLGQIVVQNALIEFGLPDADANSFKVFVKKVLFSDVNLLGSSPFHLELTTNKPQGVVRSTGQLGPWSWDDSGQTALNGSFTFEQADLSTIEGIKGLLHAQGKFSGSFRHVTSSGYLEVPQFGRIDGTHALPLLTTFHVTVNGLNGDVALNNVESRLNHTLIKSQGEIKEDEHGKGKAVHLHLSVDKGRVDDLLSLFTRSERPSMTGLINLQADADLPSGNLNFLKKLELHGDFGMSGSQFTKESTQKPINYLSESAEGMSRAEVKQDSATVLSNISGHVSTQNGIASLSNLSFVVPGANAKVAGTFNLLDRAVDLQGTLRTTGRISDTVSGLKAEFLKLLSLFLKHHSVTVVPFKITGVAPHSTLSLNFEKKKRP